MDADGDGLARGLVLGDTLDVDDVLETVDGSDLSFAALVGASNNEDFVVFSDWDGADLGLVRLVRNSYDGGSEHCVCLSVPCLMVRS